MRLVSHSDAVGDGPAIVKKTILQPILEEVTSYSYRYYKQAELSVFPPVLLKAGCT
jgi:hypothetical protein